MMGESTNLPNAPQTSKRGKQGPSTGRFGGQRGGRHLWRGALAIVLGCALLAVLLAQVAIPYTRYERVHDIPNPVWGMLTRDYTYTPATAARLNPVLLKTRPDLLMLRYIHDYIQVAGTFPCPSDLTGSTQAMKNDPVLAGRVRRCPTQRRVTAVVIDSVLVGPLIGDIGAPGALVSYTITYADGTRLASQELLWAHQGQPYFLSSTQLTCWDSLGIGALYPKIVPQIPSGVRYTATAPNGDSSYPCQP